MKATEGVFQVGVMVSDIDQCLRLFRDTLGMEVVFEARNQVQPAKGLTKSGQQIMNVLMLKGQGGAELELHQYVEPKSTYRRPFDHGDLGAMHFMVRVENIYEAVEEIRALGYEFMAPVTESSRIPGFAFTYFRGPDGMMVELHQGICAMPKEAK